MEIEILEHLKTDQHQRTNQHVAVVQPSLTNVKHFIKDLGIALESAAEMKLDLPGAALAARLYQQLAEKGGSENGTQALYKVYE